MNERDRDQVDPNVSVVQQTVPGSTEYEAAATELYANHSGVVVGALRRLMPPLRVDDLPDLAQVTFEHAFNRICSYEERHSFDGWLATIALNAGKDLIRKRNRRPEVRLPEMFESSPLVLASQGADRGDLVEPLDTETVAMASLEKVEAMELMEQLPPHYGDTLKLRLEGFENSQIADLLGIKEATVRTRIHRATERYIQLLKELK